MTSLKIFFHSYDGVGHVNACLGVARALEKRGHSIVFAVTYKTKPLFEGSASFVVEYLDEGEPDAGVNVSGQMLKDNGILSAIGPKEKLIRMTNSGRMTHLVRTFHSVKRWEDKMTALIVKHRPNVIVVDNFITPPSIGESGIPWVYLHSSSALSAFAHPATPPPMSGYSTYDRDDKEWNEFFELLEKYQHEARKLVQGYRAEKGYPPYESVTRKYHLIESPYLNLYQYPQELDYTDVRPVAAKWVRVDSYSLELLATTRQLEQFDPRLQEFLRRPGKLVYFSIGTVGCLDTDLIQRIADMLAKLPYRVIVSKGRMGDDVVLPQSNVYSANHIPQVEILPWIDVVVTHGGCNTFTETFASGKPMIVMPLFADQWDQSSRIEETNFGVRFNPYTVTEVELHSAVEKLLSDQDIQDRCRKASDRILKASSLEKACEQIEKLVN